MINRTLDLIWDALTSFKLTIAALSMLMVVVVLCTLAQVDLGTYGAVSTYMRSFFLWWGPKGSGWAIPWFPGGTLIGLALLVNLVAAMFKRLEFKWAKAGMWIVHGGLILLFAGEFFSGALQVDDRMAIEQGQTLSFVESARDVELAVADVTNPVFDEVTVVPTGVLARSASVALPGTPITLRVKQFFPNAELLRRAPSDPPSATAGVGASVKVEERAPAASDADINNPTALVEPLAGGRSYGVWLVSLALGAPQSFVHEGRTYALSMRSSRHYLPYSLTLKKFSHDVYAGTDIPKNFSSLVHISNPSKGEARDVLIYMNQPLRYEGRTFYQASFGKGDTLSVLQVVKNPGWLLPYLSCVLVTLGLLVHFAISLRRSMKRRQEKTP